MSGVTPLMTHLALRPKIPKIKVCQPPEPFPKRPARTQNMKARTSKLRAQDHIATGEAATRRISPRTLRFRAPAIFTVGERPADVQKPLTSTSPTFAFASEPPAFRSEPQTNRSLHPRHTASFPLHGVRPPLHEASGGQHGASRSLRDGGIPAMQPSAHFMKPRAHFMKHAAPAMRKTARSSQPAISPEKSTAHSLGEIIYSYAQSTL